MKAVVVERPDQVAYREVDAPAVGPDDVLVRSREAGLCRTDVEMMTGVFTDPRWVHLPVIPGHVAKADSIRGSAGTSHP